MRYANSNEAGRPMDDDYDAVTDALLERERKRLEAATMPRTGFDGDLLFGKYPVGRRYETAPERQRREAEVRRLGGVDRRD